MTEDDKAAAEGYRRQRQSVDAQRNGFEYTAEAVDEWLGANESLLREIIKANGTPDDDVQQALGDYKAHIAAASPGSNYDDKNARAILEEILRDIEALCQEQKIPTRNGIVYGVAPEFGLVARQREVMETGASIIEVSMPFIVFCNCVSKALARTLLHEEGSLIKVSNDPNAVLARLRRSPDLVAEWTRIIADQAYGWPQRRLSPAPNRLEQVTRILLLNAMEWFALAHEYGHHVMKHGQTISSEKDQNFFNDEHEADIFARAVSMALAQRAELPNMYALLGVGGVIMLGMLDLVRRARTVLETGHDNAPLSETHPPVEERLNVLGHLDQSLPEELRPTAKEMRDCFLKIIEGIWEDVLPIIHELHKNGVTPLDASTQEEGWLP